MGPASSQSMIGRTFDRYRIIEQVGKGGMGVVFRARDEKLRRDVALKLLPPDTFERLGLDPESLREALALSRISHPAVAIVHDYFTTPEWIFIVMELVTGDSLEAILRRGALEEREALRLGTQLAQGLAAAHAAGIIHRDLKPGNIAVTPDGRLKILDFGLAILNLSSTETTLIDDQVSRVVAGTPRYVAPEVWQGEIASKASDLYAAGIVLYEMATGSHPFHNLGARDIATATVKITPPSPRMRNPAVSPAFDGVIQRCMEKNPSQRLSSAKELADALDTLHSRTYPGPKPFPWRRIGIAAALLVTIGWAVHSFGVPRGWWLGLGRAPSIRSLVVLPIVNLSGDPRQEYIVDAFTDELTSSLAEYSPLRVISRTSAMHYKHTAMTVPQVARELGVEGAIQGSVKIVGEDVQESIQVIDARADRQSRTKRYEGDRSAVIDMQGRVASWVAHELGLPVDSGERPARSSLTQVQPAALQLYLLGRFQWNRRNEDGVRRAIDCFSRAIARDSLYAAAYSGLADAWTTAGHEGFVPPTEAYPRAKQAALRALSLDSSLSEAHVSLGNIRQNFDWDWEGAERDFRRAIELNDNNSVAHHWYANHLTFRGAFDLAAAQYRLAQALDPLSLPINVGKAARPYFARQYDQALVELQQVTEIDSTSGLLYRVMALNYHQLGRDEETAHAIQLWLDNDYPGALATRAAAEHRRAGLPGMVRVLIGALKKQREAGRYEPGTLIAGLSILLGDRAEAMRWLTVAFEEHDTGLNRLKVDALFDPLRSDPRFDELLRKVGLGPPS